MTPIFSRLTLQKHWSSLLWLVPSPLVGIVYEGRRLTERVTSSHGPDGHAYEYHLTPLTTSLGHLAGWLFWGGILAFVLHAICQRREGAAWFWAKVFFLPIYFIVLFYLFFQVD